MIGLNMDIIVKGFKVVNVQKPKYVGVNVELIN